MTSSAGTTDADDATDPDDGDRALTIDELSAAMHTTKYASFLD